jgi:alpha-ribazole phosphatase/probable phosphoglycerate mutase
VAVEIVFVTHSTSTDNEAGIASGHSDVSLSAIGRRQAAELGESSHGRFDAVYCSDLRRAVETAEIAFGSSFSTDARLREQDYGERTGAPSAEIEVERRTTVDAPFPGGESLRDVVRRMRGFVDEIEDDQRVLVIGHRATKIGFDVLLGGLSLEEAVSSDFAWQPGWSYVRAVSS